MGEGKGKDLDHYLPTYSSLVYTEIKCVGCEFQYIYDGDIQCIGSKQDRHSEYSSIRGDTIL